jgi:hypothetical protein
MRAGTNMHTHSRTKILLGGIEGLPAAQAPTSPTPFKKGSPTPPSPVYRSLVRVKSFRFLEEREEIAGDKERVSETALLPHNTTATAQDESACTRARTMGDRIYPRSVHPRKTHSDPETFLVAESARRPHATGRLAAVPPVFGSHRRSCMAGNP